MSENIDNQMDVDSIVEPIESIIDSGSRVESIESKSDSVSTEDTVDDLPFATILPDLNNDVNDEDNQNEDNSQTETNEQSMNSTNCSKKSNKEKNKRLVCSECQPKRYFANEKVLEQHRNLLHKQLPPELCQWCAKRFYTKNQLEVHQKLYSHDKPLD